MREVGCLRVLAVLAIFWGIVAYTIISPPTYEDIPWIVAGVSISIIIREYRKK
jgi:hypothetical protein